MDQHCKDVSRFLAGSCYFKKMRSKIEFGTQYLERFMSNTLYQRLLKIDRGRLAIRAILLVILYFVVLTATVHAQQIAARTQERSSPDDSGLKWVILVFALAGIFPLAAWIRRYPSIAPKLWTLMGILPFAQAAIPHLNIAIISWADWPGYVKGVELSALDLVALAFYLALPRALNPVPFRFSIAFYFSAVLISSFQASEPVAALFYPWQLIRIFLIYVVASRACADARFIPAVLTGMAIGLCFEAGVVIWQRFGLGELQPNGTFSHQNLLGLVSHFVVFPILAALLGNPRKVALTAVLLAGATIAVLTASRATIGLAGFGYVALFALSVVRRPTKWKAVIGLIGALAIAVLAVAAFSSLERRFAASSDRGYDERSAFELAAAMILADHPMGIGANNYAYFATTEGYSRQARVESVDLSLSPHVHNAYLLTAAETGYIGLVAFVLLLLRPLTTALLCAWKNRIDHRSEILLGFGVGLLIVCIHAYFEWVFLTLEVQYLLGMTVGMVAGLTQQMGYWKRANPRARYLIPFGSRRRTSFRILQRGRARDSVLSRNSS
jgi:O-antigen ligase